MRSTAEMPPLGVSTRTLSDSLPDMRLFADSYAVGNTRICDDDSVVTPSRPSMPKPAKVQSCALHGPKLAVTSLTSVRPPRPLTMSCRPHAPAWSSLNDAP